MNTAKEETAGTGKPLEVTYGEAIEHLRKGGMVARRGWIGNARFVCRQVPSEVPSIIIPKMSSLPESVKEELLTRVGFESIQYRNQMIMVNADNTIDSWVASSSDTFATDWVLI